MITLKQVDAALSLLGMNRSELADNLGIPKATLNAYFTGKTNISASKLSEIEKYLINCGIDFLAGGVRYFDQGTLEGQTGFRRFMDMVYEEAKKGGEFVLYNGRPHLIIKHLGEDWYKKHAKRMSALSVKPDFKVIVEEEDKNLIGATFARYRWLPKNLVRDETIYVFGDFVGLFHFSDTVKIELIRSEGLAKSLRILFSFAWEKSQEIENAQL